MKAGTRGRLHRRALCLALVAATTACGSADDDPPSAFSTAESPSAAAAADALLSVPEETVDRADPINAASGRVTWGSAEFPLAGAEDFVECTFTPELGDVVIEVRLAGTGTLEVTDRRTLPPSAILVRGNDRTPADGVEATTNAVGTAISGSATLAGDALTFVFDC